MPKLRDYFESDFDTFINEDEFADEVDIDGTKIKVVMDSDALKEIQLSNGGEGLAESTLLFHVKKSSFPFEPFVGQDLLFNEKLYYVNDVKEDEGMYVIAIGVPRS